MLLQLARGGGLATLDFRTDPTLTLSAPLLFRTDEHVFYVLMHRDQTIALMRQLSNRAMRRLLDVQVADAISASSDNAKQSKFVRQLRHYLPIIITWVSSLCHPTHAVRRTLLTVAMHSTYRGPMSVGR